MIMFKLCCSIINKNKGFTIGLFIMSVLSVAIAFMGANFGASSDETIMKFISDSKMPEAVYTTEIMAASAEDELEKTEGVDSICPRFALDTHMENSDGELYSVRVFSWNESESFRQTIHEKKKISGDEIGALMSDEFAEHNDIHPGDRVFIDTPDGRESITVEGIISNPETMECVKDEMSTYESYQFAYIYLRDGDFNRLMHTEGFANQWLVYFDKDLSVGEEKDVMREIKSSLGSDFVSDTYTDESGAMESIKDDLNTIGVICAFVPGIIWIISLFFSFIFIFIIIENQRRTIGLLRALGFTRKRVIMLFVLYTVVINVPAMICGIPAGYKLLTTCLEAVAESQGIIETSEVIVYGATACMVIVVFAIGIIASLLSSGAVSKVDPSEAYGGIKVEDFTPPKFIAGLRTDAFLKISIVSICKTYKRQIIGSLCICACIISMCVGFEGYKTIGHPIDAVFGDRLSYDLMVRGVEEDSCIKIKDTLEDVDRAETQSCFTAEFMGDDVRVSTITKEDELVELKDSSGRVILPGKGVIIDEMCSKINDIQIGDTVKMGNTNLEVTGIAREILYNVMYVSPETADKMGNGPANSVMIKLDADADVSDVKKQIRDIDKNAYIVDFDSQKENITAGFIPMRLIMLVFAVIAFGVGSLLVFNLTVIDFNEKKNKFAVLRALGTPTKRLGIVASVENLFRIVLGVILAIPLCTLCSTILLELISNPLQQFVMVDFGVCLAISCIIPFAYVFMGMGISMIRIRKMDFIKYLNEVE